MRTLLNSIPYILMAVFIFIMPPVALAGEKGSDHAEALLERGRKHAQNQEWASAKDILLNSYLCSQKSITAYLLAMTSYHLDEVNDVKKYAAKSLTLAPELRPEYRSYAKKYLDWAEAKAFIKTRSVSFSFSTTNGLNNDKDLLAEIKNRRKMKALKSKLREQEYMENMKLFYSKKQKKLEQELSETPIPTIK